MTALAPRIPADRSVADRFLGWLCAPGAEDRSPDAAVVVAHPDDEVIGLGACLPRLRSATLVYATDGAPPDGRDTAAQGFDEVPHYAAARRAERDAALRLAGISRSRVIDLPFPDQSATLHLRPLTLALARILRVLRAPFVITHPYEGGHPDHDAVALATRAAAELLRRDGVPTHVLEMTSYHLGPDGIATGSFLHNDAPVRRHRLTDSQRDLKRRLLNCFTTQRDTLRYFPIADELFRPAPRYDFTAPPHPGPLFYELHQWGMTGDRFRTLARLTLDELELTPPL